MTHLHDIALRSSKLGQTSHLSHGFFGRRGGVSQGPFHALNASGEVGDDKAAVDVNIGRIADSLALDPDRIVQLRQVHSARIVHVDAEHLDACQFCEADALVTTAVGVGLAIKTADCVPLLFWSAQRPIVAAAHGGWRGLAAGIVANVVEYMSQLGAKVDELQVAIGPHIGACCYEVGPEVIDALGSRCSVRFGQNLHADLGLAAVRYCIDAGIAEQNIERQDPCTACDSDGFFSYRRDGAVTGRQMSLIAMTTMI